MTENSLQLYSIFNNKFNMVGLDGVEPSTSRLSGVRSNRTELQALCPIQGSRQHRKMTEPSFFFMLESTS
jgi:hypothetical protein